MKVSGGGFPQEAVDRDENDDARIGFGGGDERFTNDLDKNLIWHMAKITCVCLLNGSRTGCRRSAKNA